MRNASKRSLSAVSIPTFRMVSLKRESVIYKKLLGPNYCMLSIAGHWQFILVFGPMLSGILMKSIILPQELSYFRLLKFDLSFTIIIHLRALSLF
jgi:hypothetical protein